MSHVLRIGAAAIFLFSVTPASADFAPDVLTCRAAIAKSAVKLAKIAAKTITTCHKKRASGSVASSVDCNDLSQADANGKLASAETKFVSAVAKRCAGVTPSDALYIQCPDPCDGAVPTISTFADVADCIACLTRDHLETLGQTIEGTPDAPLPSDDRTCLGAIGSSSARLIGVVAKDIVRCQLMDESAGSESTGFCSDTAFPSDTVENGLFDAENAIVAACNLDSFSALDSCDTDRFGVAECAGEETLDAAQELMQDVLGLPVTTTTLPPFVQDPLCPDVGELVLYARDSNETCTTNADCDAPRTCTAAGICGSLSDLDSGWTGLAHDSDLNSEVITLTKLICQGPTADPDPAPLCGECVVSGVDPAPGNCRCANDTRKICDQPFVSDSDDCGGATCECYFGVPIPLSSAGTPACIVNRYSEDLTGTANVDQGSSNVRAHLRTKVFLGISTTSPCPFCAGTCNAEPTRPCVYDDECDVGDTCNSDTPNDGVRDGLCINGQNDGLSCDVGGLNPTFPARSGALVGGAGYSLDCMPATGINISGAGLALDVTQTTGIASLPAVVPCSGGMCPCKTCSATPQQACNGDADCEGGSCAVSANFQCDANSDCASLNLGTCSGIQRCTLATSVTCTTNNDCQNKPGGACNLSTCSALGNQGADPHPNQCNDGVCTDIGNETGECEAGPVDRTCDGLVRADGSGILSCADNGDCTANDPLNGACTVSKTRPCFLDPIIATGVADTQFPVGAAAFCVPPTSNGSINSVAGLPGPTRTTNQGRARALCAGDHNVEYESGVGGCPP